MITVEITWWKIKQMCVCVCLFLWILHVRSASRLDLPLITCRHLAPNLFLIPRGWKCHVKPKAIKMLSFEKKKQYQSGQLPDDFTSEKGEDTRKISALPLRFCFSWPASRLDRAAVSLDTRAVGKGALHNWHIFGHFRSQVHYFSHTHTNERHSASKAQSQ